MEGLKGRCAMLLHPHVTQDSALPLLQQALAMDSDRSSPAQLHASTLHLNQALGLSRSCYSYKQVWHEK